MLEVSRSDSKYLKDQRYNHGFVYEQPKEKSIEMTFMTSSIEAFVRWIVMLADFVRFIEPIEIRIRLRELLDQMIQNCAISANE